MGSKTEKVRSRFGFSWSEWNHPLRAQILTPVLVLVGTIVGVYIQDRLVHQGITFFEQNELYGSIAIAASMLTVYFAGIAVLAVVD